MILKLIGGVFVVLACVLYALNYINNQKKRVASINNIIDFLYSLEIMIKYQLLSIPEAINLYVNTNNFELISSCNNLLKQNYTLKDAWNKSILKSKITLCLNETDINLLKDFSIKLGDTDLEGQLTNIELYKTRFKSVLEDSQSKLKENTKLALSLSFFAGLVITIMTV